MECEGKGVGGEGEGATIITPPGAILTVALFNDVTFRPLGCGNTASDVIGLFGAAHSSLQGFTNVTLPREFAHDHSEWMTELLDKQSRPKTTPFQPTVFRSFLCRKLPRKYYLYSYTRTHIQKELSNIVDLPYRQSTKWQVASKRWPRPRVMEGQRPPSVTHSTEKGEPNTSRYNLAASSREGLPIFPLWKLYRYHCSNESILNYLLW
ncbi:hypothetical protein J6590_048101 [Homalodisca vitripennis]|nr:hypothetical protein J6590_048101 [Homalodisca vitripennis]